MRRRGVSIMTIAPLGGFARGPFDDLCCWDAASFAFWGGLIRLKIVGMQAIERLPTTLFFLPHSRPPLLLEAPMRFSPSMICLVIATFYLPSTALFAQEMSGASLRMSARRDLELAKMELRHYWQVEYPRQQRHLNAAIKLTQAEIRDYQERLRAYRPFTRFSTGDPFMITIQDTRMCLREAELRLRDLWAERNALVRYHSDQYRELELHVHEARLRVVELEPADEPIVAPVSDRPAI
jgi:hypothetical protein